MIKEYIKAMTGEERYDVYVEFIEGIPVITREDYWRIYATPKFTFIGTLMEEDIDYVLKIKDLLPGICNIYDKVAEV